MTILYLILFFLGVCSGHERVYNRDIILPCPSLNMKCIRSFFTRYSHCEPAYGSRDIPKIEYLEIPLPHANVTFIWEDAKVTGLDSWNITEFYINKNTNKLVFEVELQDVTTESYSSSIIYHLKGREPVKLTDYFSFTYLNMSLTMTVPFDSVKGISWRKRVVYAYFAMDSAPYFAAKGVVNSDPSVRAAYDELMGNLTVGLRVASPAVGPHYFTMFMDNFVCRR